MESNSWISAKNPESSAVDFVVSTFRNALIERKLKAGDRIPSETELAEAMGVSRGTIREAMKILSSFGIVDIRRGNGSFIRQDGEQISMDSALFAFLLAQPTRREQVECRRYIERIVYELAINHATDTDLAALEANYSELLEQLQRGDDSRQTSRNDLEFHRILGQATGNSMIAQLYAYIMNFFDASLASSHEKNRGSAAREVHRLTIDAIRTRNLKMIDEIEQANLDSWSSDADTLYFE